MMKVFLFVAGVTVDSTLASWLSISVSAITGERKVSFKNK